MRERPLSTGDAEPPSLLRVIGKGADRRGKSLDVIGRSEDTGLAINDQLANAADVGSHHGELGKHRLDDRERQTLVARWQDEQIRARKLGHRVIDPAHEFDPLPHAPFRCETLQSRSLHPVADQSSRDVRDLRQSVDQQVEALLLVKSSDSNALHPVSLLIHPSNCAAWAGVVDRGDRAGWEGDPPFKVTTGIAPHGYMRVKSSCQSSLDVPLHGVRRRDRQLFDSDD